MLPAGGPTRQSAGYSFSEWPHPARDHLPNSIRTRGRSPSSDCDFRRSEPSHRESSLLDQGQLCETGTSGRSGGDRGHGRIYTASPFPCADSYEPSAIQKQFYNCCLLAQHLAPHHISLPPSIPSTTRHWPCWDCHLRVPAAGSTLCRRPRLRHLGGDPIHSH